MLSRKQAQDLTRKRRVVIKSRKLDGDDRAAALSARVFEEYEHLALRWSQTGFPFVCEYGGFLTIRLKSRNAFKFDEFKALASRLAKREQEDRYEWVAVLAVGYEQWRYWSKQAGFEINKALFAGEETIRDHILERYTPPYIMTGGDLHFHVKAGERDICEQRIQELQDELATVAEATWQTMGDSRHGGRVYGGKILHGIIGTVEPVGLSARAVIGDEMPGHMGGSFLVTQRFVHDWKHLESLNDLEVENLIGRDSRGNVLTNDDERSHIKLVRVNDENGINYRLLGQAHPYGEAKGGRGREVGIYQASYAKTMKAHIEVMRNMIGDEPGFIKCRHLNVSHADAGSYWYVPSIRELGLEAYRDDLLVPVNEFFLKRSRNGRMFYNTKDYLCQVGNHETDLLKDMDPLPTDRVIELLNYTFSRWHDTWYRKREAPELLGHLTDHLADHERDVLTESVQLRKGMATKKTLEIMSTDEVGRPYDVFRLHPRELIAGVVPDFTLSSMAEVMKYLDEDESIAAHLMFLDEGGMSGHNVPDYQRLVTDGLGVLLQQARDGQANATGASSKDFYRSAADAIEGVQGYLRHWAQLARDEMAALPESSLSDRENLLSVAERLERLVSSPPQTFLDAAQLVFSMHCCLHLIGEFSSIGRLDQVLAPFFLKDKAQNILTDIEAQEIIDCFWIKMDEKVLLNRHHVVDRKTRGGGAVVWMSGDFPQGAAVNQWVQQLTIGGYLANDDPAGIDGCNEITRLCLRAARRLPFNAPCLSMRVNASTPTDMIEEAAKTLLAGGAHPVLINDDKIVSGLVHTGTGIEGNESIMSLADARDMVCDGCYEALSMGKTEFAYFFCPVPDSIEMAMNRGRTYSEAGPTHMMGLKLGRRSKAAEDIESFEEFYRIFLDHYRMKMIECWAGMLGRYGNIHQFSPSPLLSTLIDGCLQKGRDMSAGGAKYRIVAPLVNGIVTTIDSLRAIHELVFDEHAITTLPELLQCLICDWGYDMKEPFQSEYTSESRAELRAEEFHNLRARALALPKFGWGNAEVSAFGRKVLRDVMKVANEVLRKPVPVIKDQIDRIKTQFGEDVLIIGSPSIATFEDYFSVGGPLGASADGRRNKAPVSSDFSPNLWPYDQPIKDRRGPEIMMALESWAAHPDDAHYETEPERDPMGIGIPCGSPVDVRVRESFPLDKMIEVVRGFADGKIGPNMMTVSVADISTMQDAQQTPEVYDILRMRMGGWSEFFVAMFPHQQEHHMRRPFFESE